MSDFASGAMVRILIDGMQLLGLQPPTTARPQNATVDLDLKRQFLQSAQQQGGLHCLPLLGQGLHQHAHDPTHRALISAPTPGSLFERWARLEYYTHSQHRVQLVTSTSNMATLNHVARGGKPAPSAIESLLVLGVLIALLQAIGATNVEAHAGGFQAYPNPDAAGLEQAATRGLASQWVIAWRFNPKNNRLPAWDFNDAKANPPAAELVAVEPWPDEIKRLFVHIANHLVGPLTLKAQADALHTSPRSLQRMLHACRHFIHKTTGRGALPLCRLVAGLYTQAYR